MEQVPRIRATWRWPAFCGLHLLAALLFASWLPAAGRELWREAGSWLFFQLNGSLGVFQPWDAIWAFGNTRIADTLTAILMVILTLHPRWAFAGAEGRRALLHVLMLLGILLLVRSPFSDFVKHMQWQHASPSKTFTDIYILSEAFPQLNEVSRIKHRASNSFPGDHASVVLIWTLFMAHFCRGWKLAACIIMTLLCVMPRLIVGAHWLDDVAVGGVMMAALTFAWGYYTPLASLLIDGIDHLLRPLLLRLRKLPWIGKWDTLRDV